MATPHLNNIINAFTEKIGDPATYSGGGVLQNGNILTANQIVRFVNQAMMELFRRYWTGVNGNEKLFAEIFPELVKSSQDITILAGSKYPIGNPHLDFMKAFGAYYKDNNNAYIRVAPKDQYVALLSGVNSRISATVDKPVLVEIEKTIYVFPDITGDNIIMLYIKLPLDYTNGSFLAQNGTDVLDSPFYDSWNDEIASIAEKLYRIAAQEGE